MTLACEDAYSKLVEVVTVADNTITKLNLGQDYEARFSQDLSLSLVGMLMFG